MSQKLDYKDVLTKTGISVDDPEATPVLKQVNKLNALMGVLSFLGIDVKQLLQDFIKGLLAKRQAKAAAQGSTSAPAPAPAQTQPQPNQPGVGGGDPAPAPAPAPPTSRPFGDSVPSSFSLVPFWYQKKATAETEDRGTFKSVANGDDPMLEQSRFAFDCDIIDQYGDEIQVDDTNPAHVDWAHENLWQGTAPNDTHRMRWHLDGSDVFEIAGAGVHGFTPIIKVPKGALAEDNEDYFAGALVGEFTRKDGRVFRVAFPTQLRARR